MNLLSLKLETKRADEVKYNTNPAGPLSLYPWSAVLAKQQQRKYKIPRFTFSDIYIENLDHLDQSKIYQEDNNKIRIVY